MTNEHINKGSQVLNNFLPGLIGKYNPEKIICFGSVQESRSTSGCFIKSALNESFHFFLVIILPDARASLMHEIQDYANRHFNKGRITIVAQSWESIQVSLEKGKTFYNYVLRNGVVLYTRDDQGSDQYVPPDIDHAFALQLAESAYRHRKDMARGFLYAAKDCMKIGFHNNALFQLHQATEQACIQAIRLYLSYRCEIHNLDRLLDLIKCFAPELTLLFPRKTTRQRQLFELLKESYSTTRYRSDFKADQDDVCELYELVTVFVDEVDVVSFRKLGLLTKAAQKVAASHADYRPAVGGV
ncbi:HEPN domain-containing protein [Mucilaginibacter sp. NFX135]|uniref:HEPN domain-containing protein n=1 Tax=Mucilaginibacter sp. NFX135 TaxID=3402687 RepID=UPI003AFA5C76